MITTKMNFKPNEIQKNEKAGLTVMGADKGTKALDRVISEVKDGIIYLRIKVSDGVECQYSYSFDGKIFANIDEKVLMKKEDGLVKKTGIFCIGESQTNDCGYADFDWFRVEALPKLEFQIICLFAVFLKKESVVNRNLNGNVFGIVCVNKYLKCDGF